MDPRAGLFFFNGKWIVHVGGVVLIQMGRGMSPGFELVADVFVTK